MIRFSGLGLPAWTSAASLTSTATRASAATAAAFARDHGTGFIDDQRAAHQVAAVAGFNGTIGSRVVVDFNEPESASLAGKTIAHNIDAVDGNTRLREEIR
jgi:FKBP-type peptidyl-prolyl cis-trans isomerase 2